MSWVSGTTQLVPGDDAVLLLGEQAGIRWGRVERVDPARLGASAPDANGYHAPARLLLET